jgi:hypothetical protein
MDTLEEKMFCVMFDTRRYDWFRKIKVEDKEDMDLIQTMTHVKMIQPQDGWLPLLENNFETLQWVKVSEFDTRDSVSKLEPGYAFKNTNKRRVPTLHTLPDFEFDEDLTENLLDAIMDGVKNIRTADSCVYECKELLKYKTWWSMRGESGKLITYRAADKTKMYGFAKDYEDETISKFMGDIDAILTSSASESMEH